MPKFYPLKVLDITPESSDSVSISFDMDDRTRRMFSFRPGQFVTLRKRINGQVLRRPYSICSSVDEPTLRIAVKRVPNGRFSGFATNELCVGDVIEATQPEGKFFLKFDAAAEHRYVLCATGSGITPMMSIIKSALVRESRSHITLFYGNRKHSTTIFRRELNQLMSNHTDRLTINWFLSGAEPEAGEFKGHLGAELGVLVPEAWDIKALFLCGVPAMASVVSQAFIAAGLPASRIHSESFLSGDLRSKRPDDLCLASTVRIRLNGEETVLQPGQRTILEAALDVGLDPAYSCSSGACSTCLAKVVGGRVGLVTNNTLSKSDQAKGWTLLCQAYAASDEVTIECADI